MNATDPANVFGGEASELKFARVPSTYLAMAEGQILVLAQENGERLTVAPRVNTELTAAALRALFLRPNAPRRTVVREWNGEAVLGSAGEKALKEVGFYRVPKGMEFWRRSA